MVQNDENKRPPHHKVKPKPKRKPVVPRVEEPKVADRLGRLTQRNVRAMCTARRADGEPCRAYAVAGSNVCSVHGGMAPQVRRAAAVRLAMAQDWLMEELLKIALSEDDVKVRLDAIKSALARGGFGDRNTVEIETVSRPTSPFDEAVGLVRVRRGPRGSEPPAIEATSPYDDIINAEVVDENGDRVPISYAESIRRRPPVTPPREPHIDVNPDVPSYLDPVTGGRRRERVGPRTSEMKR